MNPDSRKTGADYQTFEDRLPTVKLTDPEKLNLITLIASVFDSGIVRRIHVEDAMAEVFGKERAGEYLRLFDVREPGERWSRRENVQMIGKILPLIPGTTEDEKAAWIIERVAPCFTADRWTNVIMPYVLERIAEYKEAGGTLGRWPSVVVPPTPEPTPAPALPVNPAIPASSGRAQEAYFARKNYDKSYRIRFPTALQQHGGTGSYVMVNGYRAEFRGWWTDEPGAKRPSYTMPIGGGIQAPVTCVLHSADGVARAYFIAGNAERWRGRIPGPTADAPAQPDQPAPPAAQKEIVWSPQGGSVRVDVPAELKPWKAWLVGRRVHCHIWETGEGSTTYTIPMSADAIIAASRAGGNADGTVMFGVNTPHAATGPHKHVAWRVMAPAKQGGDVSRIPLGQNN